MQLLRSVLEQMLEAANWAPTHGRTEPWRFVVLSPHALQEMFSITDGVISDLTMSAMHVAVCHCQFSNFTSACSPHVKHQRGITPVSHMRDLTPRCTKCGKPSEIQSALQYLYDIRFAICCPRTAFTFSNMIFCDLNSDLGVSGLQGNS